MKTATDCPAQDETSPTDLFTVTQIMEHTGNGCTRDAVLYFIRKKKIPAACMAGNCRLFGRDVMEKFIEARIGQTANK